MRKCLFTYKLVLYCDQAGSQETLAWFLSCHQLALAAGLDTVEDDMALPDAMKLPALHSFHESIYQR